MAVYIFTLPKAGTYFLAALLSNLGLNDTGYHLSRLSYLDTKRLSLEENAETPGRAKVEKYFVPVVRRLQPDDVAFGHFPLPLNPQVAPNHMRYICAFRSPEKTLVSEFVDFRFRRRDVAWVSRQQVADDAAAFELYLERHGTVGHLSIFRRIVLYNALINHPLADPAEAGRACFVNFETVLAETDSVRRIAAFLGRAITAAEAAEIHARTLAGETKTKAVDLKIDRAALWTDRARELYEASGFPAAVAVARRQGMQI